MPSSLRPLGCAVGAALLLLNLSLLLLAAHCVHARRLVDTRLQPSPLKEPAVAVPSYEHSPAKMMLPPQIRVPSVADCGGTVRWPFIAVAMYSAAYTDKERRLAASCVRTGTCYSSSLVPPDTFGDATSDDVFRRRLIATKPLFILRTLEASPVPVAWMDVDLELMKYPSLFLPGAWVPPRDALLWNWRANETANLQSFGGRRLKMASGVAFFNRTAAARALLRGWAQAMAYEPNALSADDLTMDLLVNKDAWIDRASFGWLPVAYLRTLAQSLHAHVDPVIEHDAGRPPGLNGMGGTFPVLPPHAQPF